MKFSSCLRGIDVKDDPLLTANGTNGGDVLNDTNFVVDEHNADQNGIRAQSGFENLKIQQAIFLNVKVSDLKTLAL